MARQTVPITLQPPSYPDPALAPVFAALNFKQENVTDHSQFAHSERRRLLVWNKDAGTNEVQAIATDSGTVASGTFTFAAFTIHGIAYTPGNIARNATPAIVAAAILAAVDANGTALSTRYPDSVVGTGANLPVGTVTLTFTGALAGQLIGLLVTDSTNLVGGTFAATETTPGAGGHTVTVPSVPDSPFNRTADIEQVVGGGTVIALPAFKGPAWKQSDGTIHVNGDSTNLYFAVLETPSA